MGAAAAQMALFAEPLPEVRSEDLLIARHGLAHFRHQVAAYGRQWPYLMPEWQAWISYFEKMARDGYAAAQPLRPREEESEPSKLFAALTRRRAEQGIRA